TAGSLHRNRCSALLSYPARYAQLCRLCSVSHPRVAGPDQRGCTRKKSKEEKAGRRTQAWRLVALGSSKSSNWSSIFSQARFYDKAHPTDPGNDKTSRKISQNRKGAACRLTLRPVATKKVITRTISRRLLLRLSHQRRYTAS